MFHPSTAAAAADGGFAAERRVGRRHRSTPAERRAAGAGAQQQTRAASRCQPTYETEPQTQWRFYAGSGGTQAPPYRGWPAPRFSGPPKCGYVLEFIRTLDTLWSVILRIIGKFDVRFKVKMHKIRFPPGFRPRPRWVNLQRSPRPTSCI